MASKPSGIAKMIVQYEWTLDDVEKEPKTFASTMIAFREERVFRVGLKNHVERPVLFFMAVDLNEMGMKVEEVMVGNQGSGIDPVTSMVQMTQENIGDEGSLQLFTIELSKQVVLKCTFLFRICIEGSVPGYSYQLSDRLAKDQLWESQNLVDVELVVKGKKFHSHKAILAARSPVFATEFMKEQPEGPHQIRFDGMEPFTVEQFLHFIYTGESLGSLANEGLLKLADQYQLSTLANLCRVALKKRKVKQMANFIKSLNKEAEIPSSEIRLEGEQYYQEIFVDRNTPTFRCALSFDISENQPPLSVMQYQNEEIFFAFFTGKRGWNGRRFIVHHPVIHCLCPKLSSFGLKVVDIYSSDKRDNWFQMELKNFQKNAELLRFTTQPKAFDYLFNSEVYFDIKIESTIDSYYYEVMDDAWMKDFWFAATNQKFTDVEIFVGTVKVMEAHRVVLSARSPVLNESLSKITNTRKSIVTFGAEFDVDTVKHFLKFLYTGSLESSASDKQLLTLATLYDVKTLSKMCLLANRVPDADQDVEELTNCLLQP